MLRGLGYLLRSNIGTSLPSTRIPYGPTEVFPSPIMPHCMSGLDQLQPRCPHGGEHSLGPQLCVTVGHNPGKQHVPVLVSERIWLVRVHTLIEVMDVTLFHWQALGELLTAGLLFFCSELGQPHGMLKGGGVVYLQHEQGACGCGQPEACNTA